MTSIIEAKQVGKQYKNFTLQDISFTLEEGYIMGLIGRNGAGKTTLIKLIVNYPSPKGNGLVTAQ